MMMNSKKNAKMKGLGIFAGLVFGVAGLCLPAAAHAADLDQVTFRDGKVVTGEILEETPTEVKMRVVIAGIEAITTYQRSEIISISHDSVPSADGAAATGSTGAGSAGLVDIRSSSSPAVARDPNIKTVYFIELEGIFGLDISQTPIREAVKDAQKYQPDYLVVVMNNRWDEGMTGGLQEDAIADDSAAFDQLFRAEDIEPIFTREIRVDWDKQPKVVFWVKQAMGGAAFLPFISDTIYMSSGSRIGGVGDVDQMFDGVGDAVVREKQRSLRMGHARGMAIQGGHDTRIIRAMTQMHFVLSYRMEGGKPVFIERMPQNSTEFLLTDDGVNERGDNIAERARNLGDDVLTIKPDVAVKIGVARAIVDTEEELFASLGISRNHEVIKGRGNTILTAWRDGLKAQPRSLQRILEDFQEIQVQGDFSERSKARAAKMRKLKDYLALAQKYEEAAPPEYWGLPGAQWARVQIVLLELEQMADRR